MNRIGIWSESTRAKIIAKNRNQIHLPWTTRSRWESIRRSWWISARIYRKELLNFGANLLGENGSISAWICRKDLLNISANLSEETGSYRRESIWVNRMGYAIRIASIRAEVFNIMYGRACQEGLRKITDAKILMKFYF